MNAEKPAWGKPLAPVVAAYHSAPQPKKLVYSSAQVSATFTILSLCVLVPGLLGLVANNVVALVALANRPEGGDLMDQFGMAGAVLLFFSGIAVLFGLLASVISFSLWLHRVYRNLPTLVEGTFLTTPGWAVGSCFIPILNLFRPYQAAREVEVYSNPDFAGGRFASAVGGSLRLKTWWTLWIVANVASWASSCLSTDDKDRDVRIVANWVEGISFLLMVLAAIALFAVIRKITRDQDASADRIAQTPPELVELELVSAADQPQGAS